MVSVTDKPITKRNAKARAVVHVGELVMQRIRDNQVAKGDVLLVAKIAGIQAAKQTHSFIPLCHQIALDHVGIDFTTDHPCAGAITIETTATAQNRTGVEMEALTAASVAALTVYDMCKALNKSIVIDGIRLLEKSGGKSGVFVHQNDQ